MDQPVKTYFAIDQPEVRGPPGLQGPAGTGDGAAATHTNTEAERCMECKQPIPAFMQRKPQLYPPHHCLGCGIRCVQFRKNCGDYVPSPGLMTCQACLFEQEDRGPNTICKRCGFSFVFRHRQRRAPRQEYARCKRCGSLRESESGACLECGLACALVLSDLGSGHEASAPEEGAAKCAACGCVGKFTLGYCDACSFGSFGAPISSSSALSGLPERKCSKCNKIGVFPMSLCAVCWTNQLYGSKTAHLSQGLPALELPALASNNRHYPVACLRCHTFQSGTDEFCRTCSPVHHEHLVYGYDLSMLCCQCDLSLVDESNNRKVKERGWLHYHAGHAFQLLAEVTHKSSFGGISGSASGMSSSSSSAASSSSSSAFSISTQRSSLSLDPAVQSEENFLAALREAEAKSAFDSAKASSAAAAPPHVRSYPSMTPAQRREDEVNLNPSMGLDQDGFIRHLQELFHTPQSSASTSSSSSSSSQYEPHRPTTVYNPFAAQLKVAMEVLNVSYKDVKGAMALNRLLSNMKGNVDNTVGRWLELETTMVTAKALAAAAAWSSSSSASSSSASVGASHPASSSASVGETNEEDEDWDHVLEAEAEAEVESSGNDPTKFSVLRCSMGEYPSRAGQVETDMWLRVTGFTCCDLCEKEESALGYTLVSDEGRILTHNPIINRSEVSAFRQQTFILCAHCVDNIDQLYKINLPGAAATKITAAPNVAAPPATSGAVAPADGVVPMMVDDEEEKKPLAEMAVPAATSAPASIVPLTKSWLAWCDKLALPTSLDSPELRALVAAHPDAHVPSACCLKIRPYATAVYRITPDTQSHALSPVCGAGLMVLHLLKQKDAQWHETGELRST